MTKILVVDDDADFQDMIEAVLAAAGYEVEKAFDGRQGLAKAAEWQPDLIILDVMMTTDHEGFEVARALRTARQTAGIPVIMLSAIHEEKKLNFRYEPDELRLPVKRFLDKPVKPAVLLQAVAEALNPPPVGK